MSCTLVTAYYRFPSKHSVDDYKAWMTNFLTTNQSPMVIFCDEDCFAELQALRRAAGEAAFKQTTILVKPLGHLMCAQEPYASYWKRDIQRDHERAYHNPNLYIVWNEKSNLVRQAIELDIYKTPWYCWCDIGCFRDSNPVELQRLRNFPQITCPRPHPGPDTDINHDKMYLLTIEPFQEREIQFYKTETNVNMFQFNCRIGGTIFLGSVGAWGKWYDIYYNTLNEFMKHDLFAGKDQSIMAVIALRYPQLVKLIEPVPGDGNPWFYLQRYFM